MAAVKRILVLTLLLLVAPALVAQQGGATITILHINDVYEITPVEGGKAGGLARVATLRARLRAQQPGLLTTLGGDYLSPSALGTAVVNGERLAGRQMVAVLNVLGVDWATFGNHEFDVSEAAFRSRLAESKFRLVSSNVTGADGKPFPGIPTFAIVPVTTGTATVRVGLIGLTVDANQQRWVRYAPPIEAARAALAHLRGKVDAIVALTHLTLQGDQEVAEQLQEIDLILGGHEHENWLLRRGARLTPIVKADANARTVAVVTLRIARRGARPIVSARFEPIDDRIPEGRRTSAEVSKWTELGFQGFRQNGFEPSQIVATLTMPLDGREATIRNRSSLLADVILDAMRREASTDLAILNSGSIRIDDVLPPGPMTQYDVIRVLPFGGRVLKATFTGALLSRVLEVGIQNRGTGGFLHAAAPQAIDPGRRYTVAITDFLMTGGETNLGFLTRQSPDVSDVSELRDIRMAVIDELRRRFPPAR